VMSTTLKIPPEFDTVSEGEKIAFVQELWDRIARDPDRVPIPDDHKRVLDERLDAYRENPQTGHLWSEVREQLLAKLRSS
jgi:putative addiction module component (TIGR02574 family)